MCTIHLNDKRAGSLQTTNLQSAASPTSIQSSYVVQTTMPSISPSTQPSTSNTNESSDQSTGTIHTSLKSGTTGTSFPTPGIPSTPNKAGSELKEPWKLFWSAMCFLALFGLFGS
ncbi:6988_t:CDS:2 [Ambispora leptoticha]|uniref:6988_t:CDS:1 n=1 Tax=Ambispora leptoticha TaxID=144679 RepID=A0A9N9A2X8_9GLOM|nr:6988_t:CDS:2 [Ambispora leptoticha]